MTRESRADAPPAREKSIFMSRAWARAALAAGVLAATAVSAGGASAQEVCVSPAAKAALSQCPAGVTKPGPGKKKEVTLKAPPPKAAPKSVTTPPNPDPTPGQGPRDDRRIRMQARSYKLLVTEIQQVETLVAATPAN